MTNGPMSFGNASAARDATKIWAIGVQPDVEVVKYEPQKKKWTDQRIGQALNINGEEYKIVAISKDEVVLSAPNQKKTTIKSTGPPPS